VVAHSHRHHEHVAGRAQFEGRPGTTVVGKDRLSVMKFFAFTNCPGEVLRLDLGGRVQQITGTAGHHVSSISILDGWSGFLLPGDVLYPGRLCIQDMAAFAYSLDRILGLVASGRVRHVMDAHIEMSRTARWDYPPGATCQHDEPSLQMSIEQLRGLGDGAVSIANCPGAHVLDEFAMFHGPCRPAIAHQRARDLWGSLCRS
jgi:hydroxyacylglutathione hydrolase